MIYGYENLGNYPNLSELTTQIMWQSLERQEPERHVLKYTSTGSTGLTTNLPIRWVVTILEKKAVLATCQKKI